MTFTAEEQRLAEVSLQTLILRLRASLHCRGPRLGRCLRARDCGQRSAATSPTHRPLLPLHPHTLGIGPLFKRPPQPQPVDECKLQAWYMDDSDEDQRLPHQLSVPPLVAAQERPTAAPLPPNALARSSAALARSLP